MRPVLGRAVLSIVVLVQSPGVCVAASAKASPSSPSKPKLESWLGRKACSIPSPAFGAESCAGLPGFIARGRQAIGGASDAKETIDRLNDFFFRFEKFQVTYDLSSADHLLPGPVLSEKRGYCVGLAAVYLILAEELDLPIHAVATPKHVFLRWDDGKFRRNIELFQEGREVPDADYLRDEKIPQESIKRGVFLASMSNKEFLGFIYQNLGVLESQQGNFKQSEKYYAKAIRLNGKLAATYYNRGNDELKQEQFQKAIRDYDKSLKLYPGDDWAMRNRKLAQGMFEKMRNAE
jgi:tetratricopeptide (TPR) repeat protein